MENTSLSFSNERYRIVKREKSEGATFTPKCLADFVAENILQIATGNADIKNLRILDPAIGHGALLISLLEGLSNQPDLTVEVHGFETDSESLRVAKSRIKHQFPNVSLHFKSRDFLGFVLENLDFKNRINSYGLFRHDSFDLIIANPPYVRTQVMGAGRAQQLAKQFNLTGRVDLYQAFILGMLKLLNPNGIAGIIVSNRFMTTKSGVSVRRELMEHYDVTRAYDLGDTKIFNAAILPAVLFIKGKNRNNIKSSKFTSIYQTERSAESFATDPIQALKKEGIVEIDDGRRFNVIHGKLDTSGTTDGVWRVATREADDWLTTVDANSWGKFGDIGKIRVGVKTCADKIFIRDDWQEMPDSVRPELLRPVTTHHIASRFKPLAAHKQSQILYPHEVSQGRRCAVSLTKYPRSKDYLAQHRVELESREYVTKAGREWYEIWVPHAPDVWQHPKIVFRDIADEPTFWVDLGGSVVNGDCYWLTCQNSANKELLWLAVAVGNSKFIERFYDYRFHNKLYAGRRRFMTQYVEKFPLPDPEAALSKEIISIAKLIYECTPSLRSTQLQSVIEKLIWDSFGLEIEEGIG